MQTTILQLYPASAETYPLEGLYLGHNLRKLADESGQTYIYSNFVLSLDGRIAIPDPDKGGLKVPEQTANDRDWRLFQELAIQADLIISTGRYLRDYAAGKAQEILRVYDDPRFADLKDWRLAQGLQEQPDLAVISGSLKFPIPEVLTRSDRKVLIFTIANADADRIRQLEDQTGKVIIAGDDRVEGRQLAEGLYAEGYRTVYSSAGPKVHHLLLQGDVLDRMYLTHAHRVLGASSYASPVEGDLLQPPVGFKLNTIYLDQVGLDGLGQLFISYDRA